MFRELFKWITKIVWVCGFLLVLLLVLESIDLFFKFHSIHPTVGWVFAGILAVIFCSLLLYITSNILRFPKVLSAPELPALDEASFKEKHRYVKFLRKYVQQLNENANLEEEHHALLETALAEINSTLGAHPLHDDLNRIISRMDHEFLMEPHAHLKEKALGEIRYSVRDVMLAVTFSPYPRMDLFIVFFRNIKMVLRIISIYETRPNALSQWRILCDVFKVVITVNFLNAGRNLLEGLFANLPFLGRVVDDIAQGLGAGFLTSASGYAAIDRCSAYKHWDVETAESGLIKQAKVFLGDVRDIFTKDILPNMKNRIKVTVPENVSGQPEFWDSIQTGIMKAVDTTASATDTLLIKPAKYTGTTISKGTSGILRYFNRK